MSLSQVLQRRHLPALDGLRAVAVGTVVVYHGGVSAVPGDLGVTAFFVLSGFLITWLLLREEGHSGGIDLGAFYMRRILRIFPAYFALIFFSLAVDYLIAGDPWTAGRIASAFTYTLNYHNAFFGHEGPIAHGWSLAVEEQFYLLWPAAFLAWGTRIRRMRSLIALIGVVIVWRAVLLLLRAPEHYLYNAFETRMDSLAIGCLLALLCQSKSFVAVGERVSARWWYPVPVLAALVFSRVAMSDLYHYFLGFSVDSLLVAVLLIQLLPLSAHAAWNWIEHRATRWIGTISYPLYLWHIWGLDVGRNLPGGRLVQFAAGVVLSIGLVAASYYGLERYFLKLKHAYERRTPPVAAASTRSEAEFVA